jgi:hypothetical protein
MRAVIEYVLEGRLNALNHSSIISSKQQTSPMVFAGNTPGLPGYKNVF